MTEHSSFVNSYSPARRGPPFIVSGSNDGTVKLWDIHQGGAIQTFPDKYQITTVSFSCASDKIYTGGIDNDMRVWDLILNMAKEVAMRIMVSEKKTRRFEQEVQLGKDEAFRMLLRLKQMMDSKRATALLGTKFVSPALSPFAKQSAFRDS